MADLKPFNQELLQCLKKPVFSTLYKQIDNYNATRERHQKHKQIEDAVMCLFKAYDLARENKVTGDDKEYLGLAIIELKKVLEQPDEN